jgi:hypothetical protein
MHGVKIKIDKAIRRKNQQYALIVPSVGTHNTRSHDNPAHRPRNHTLYDIPTLSCVFQVTQEDPISSLMMAGYCRNM